MELKIMNCTVYRVCQKKNFAQKKNIKFDLCLGIPTTKSLHTFFIFALML